MPDLKLWGARELDRLKKDMERLFDSLCTDYGVPGVCAMQSEVEVAEDEAGVTVRLCVPDLEPDDIRLSVTDLGIEISVRHLLHGSSAPFRAAPAASIPTR